MFCEKGLASARSRYWDTWATDCSISSAASLTSPRSDRACRQAFGHISCPAARTSARICLPEESNSLSHQSGAFLASAAITKSRAEQARKQAALSSPETPVPANGMGDGDKGLRNDFRGRLQRGWRIGKYYSEVAVASLRVMRVDSTAIVAHMITAGLVADAESRGLA